MSRIAVVYWSGTGNTEAMACAVADGVKGAGGEAEIIAAASFGPDKMENSTPSRSAAPRWAPRSLRTENSSRCSNR